MNWIFLLIKVLVALPGIIKLTKDILDSIKKMPQPAEQAVAHARLWRILRRSKDTKTVDGEQVGALHAFLTDLRAQAK